MDLIHAKAVSRKVLHPHGERGAMASVIVAVGALCAIVAFFLLHQGDEYRAMNEKYHVPRAELSFQLRQILDCSKTVAKTGFCPVLRPVAIYDVNGTKRWDATNMTFTDRKNITTEYRVVCDASPKKYVLQTRRFASNKPWARAEGIRCP